MITEKRNKRSRSVHLREKQEPVITWILLMRRGRAKLLEQRSHAADIRLVEGFVNPAGDLRNIELVADRAGRIDRCSGAGGHSAAPTETAHEHAVTSFARSLAEKLEAGLVNEKCTQIVIAAEPHCLGKLKGELGRNSKKRIRAVIPKDLFLLSKKELALAVARQKETQRSTK